MVSSSREDLVEDDQVTDRKFSGKREGFEDQLESAVNLTIRVTPTLLLPSIHLPSSERCCGEDIARLAEFVIKSNGDGQTRARIVTSNRIILRHRVSIPCPAVSPASTCLNHVSRLAYDFPPIPISVSDLQNSPVPVGATALN